MKRTNDSRGDDKLVLPQLKVYRVNRKLCAGDVSIHEAAGAAFSLWRDLRRHFPTHSLVKPEFAALLRPHIPMQAIEVHKRWQIFGGFEAYTELQSLSSPDTKLRIEIQRYKKVGRAEVETLSLALLMHNIEMYSVCSNVADEQIRKRIETGFSPAAQEAVLACDISSQRAFASSLGRTIDFLKRQTVRLKPKKARDASFLSDVIEAATHEKKH